MCTASLRLARSAVLICPFPLVIHPPTPAVPLEKERINDHVEKGKRHKISPFFPDLSPVRRRGCVAVVTKRPYFDKVTYLEFVQSQTWDATGVGEAL